MAIKTFGSGWDPNSGWAPDDSTDVQWQNDVELPGQFKGGGAGFGPGGFQGNPSLTAPASGPPPGISLSNGGASAAPTNAAGMSPHIDPTTGQPEMLTGPGGLVDKTRGSMNPFGFIGRGNPYWRSAIAAGGVLTPTPAETGELSPRFFTGQGVQPGLSAPQGTPYEVPRGMPGRAVDAPQTYPHMPWPDTGIASAAPAASPAASPAATRQRPNLGTYGAPSPVVPNSPFTTLDYRPNSGPNERNRGSPVATALDLSRLFGGGQSVAAPVAVRSEGGVPTAANPNNPYWGPNSAGRSAGGGPIMPQDITGYPVAGVNVPAAASGYTVNPDLSTRRPRSKSSSSSQGGGQ